MSDEQEHNETEVKEPMSKHQFYFETPLYEILGVEEVVEDFDEGDVDGYNSISGFDTTYKINRGRIGDQYSDYYTFYTITLTCKRNNTDKIRFFVLNNGKAILKVGQWQSLADIQFAELGKKYDKVLDEDSLFEFKRAIGLAAHGTGVGSFVYLRRIFEKLIFQTFDAHKSTLGVEKKDFAPMRMEDKVELLKAHLPSQLVEMKSVYSILSKGIHQLSENECLAYFEPLKLSIELVLDQKIEMDLKRQRDERVKDEIKNIHTKLGK
ncbi:MAG: hypothetical protein A2644_03960 [Candidatus Zambryskibacteria bacterium RIFCSPHIGHO2_01_FULL_39_63]|nr:MAG: hypothetical protein A2644_03960 [Candidatus Zambryskibacteria bacterium RIFCSPHIGHO2_01_FULL_39_63]